ncbi:hypothetical protein FXO37_35127 [Capsicum annuum]|nr:hypothetical protein FXO37_35127 [Capsicum annuum]
MELIKKELTGATNIRRAVRKGQPHVEVLYDQPAAIDSCATYGGVGGDSVASGFVDVGASHDDEYVSNAEEKINITRPKFNLLEDDDFQIILFNGPKYPSSKSCSLCKCKKCKDRHDRIFKRIDDLTDAINVLTSKRGVIPSNKGRETYTTKVEVRKKKKSIGRILSNRKSRKITNPYPSNIDEVQVPSRKVDIYTLVRTNKMMTLRNYKNSKHPLIAL